MTITMAESGGEEWIRTIEGISQQIYSLPRLATSVPLHQQLKQNQLDSLGIFNNSPIADT